MMKFDVDTVVYFILFWLSDRWSDGGFALIQSRRRDNYKQSAMVADQARDLW